MYSPRIKVTFATLALLASTTVLVPVAQAQSSSLNLSGVVKVNAVDNTTTNIEPIVLTRNEAQATLTVGASATTAASSSTAANTGNPSSEEGLRTHAVALLSEDTNLSSVTLSPEQVALIYHEPAKLLGFINIRVPVRVSVVPSGKASVRYPWYNFLLSTDQTSLSIEAQAVAADILSTSSSNEASLSSYTQAHLLDSLHAVLQDSAEATSTSSTT